jgi:hypothetical protein
MTSYSFTRFRNGAEDLVDLANNLQASAKLSQKVKQLLNFSASYIDCRSILKFSFLLKNCEIWWIN